MDYRICELWPFVCVISNLSYVIDFSSQILSLYMVKEGKTYPVIDVSIHGKHDGTIYSSMWHSIRKLHLFLLVPFRLPYQGKILPEHTFGFIDYKHLINWNLQLCQVFADPVTYSLTILLWIFQKKYCVTVTYTIVHPAVSSQVHLPMVKFKYHVCTFLHLANRSCKLARHQGTTLTLINTDMPLKIHTRK